MNRFKKEEKKRHDQARKELTGDQVAALDLEDERARKIETLAREIHIDKFPEEYDFMYDSGADIKDRKNNINPMNQKYIDKTKKKRSDLKVSQLSEAGMPLSDDTMKLCLQDANNIVNNQ